MSTNFTLKAELRQNIGKGASRRLRRQADQVPAIMYGANKPAQTLSVLHNDIMKLAQHEAFFSSILAVEINGTKEQAILKDMQRHPYKPQILHLDLLRISATEKLTMHVPIHFIGEEKSAGVKAGGVLTKQMIELEIRCLPADLPESIDIDITNLELDTSLHLSDVKLPNGVTLAHPVVDDAHDHVVVSVSVPRVTEEPEETAVVAASEVPSGQKDEAADKDKANEKAADDKAKK